MWLKKKRPVAVSIYPVRTKKKTELEVSPPPPPPPADRKVNKCIIFVHTFTALDLKCQINCLAVILTRPLKLFFSKPTSGFENKRWCASFSTKKM